MEDWNQLKYFLAVARHGNVSRAARFLNVSHATVLRHINQCELALETKLFEKLQTGYTLTPKGRALFEKVALIDADIEAIKDALTDDGEPISGSLKITQPDNDVINLFPIYREFKRAYPQISLEITSTSEVANLNQREADVAIRFTNQPHELLVGKKLGKLSYSAYASEGYLKRLGGNPKLTEMEWLIWQQPGRSLDASPQYRWLQRNAPQAAIAMKSNGVSDLVSAMRAGIGAGFLSHDMAREYPTLIPVNGVTIHSEYQIWILAHRDQIKVPKVKVFVDFVKTHFARRNEIE